MSDGGIVSTPHEVLIFTVAEVLLDIYEGDLDSVDTEVATKAFYEWINQNNAHYYSNSKSTGHDIMVEAVLDAIKKGKHIVVVSDSTPAQDND